MPHSPRLAYLFTALLLVPTHSAAHAQAATQSADPALLQAVLEGRLSDAIPQLERSLQHAPSPANELLLCRALRSENHFDDALPHCQTAADSPSPTSAAFLWLGRVQGGRASKANPLAAFALARKVKSAFSRAVELDPRNADAVDDLGEYLVEAPAIVGGGIDQARDLAAQSLATTPSAAHHILARVAAKSDDATIAEREYRASAAAASGPNRAGALVDLARFLQRHNRPDTAAATLRDALTADRPVSAASVDAAGLLNAMKAPPAQSIALLRAYLVSPARSDAAPAWRVHLHLARLLAALGESAAANHERALAQQLAPDATPPDPGRTGRSDSQPAAPGQVP